ncbi:type IV pilus modification PilV family protein [Massilia glaciei]|uniref:Type IV pilus modification protein PilV n=1 Tax=Massilia glaciei TaxID=1524097 RepID=A0A2U2HE47_9BURK|nr:prepilin-type N-terminal cleavage/methylation domain-containing protein [Massilia glaciei]PWF41596.1 type IV pilus modification protein PilV [Massilia glaciei]
MANHRPRRHDGTTLIEVLVTMVILAFGLLGLAAFQSKVQIGSLESYQRAQAVILLADMQARMNGNYVNAGSYVGATYGAGDTVTSCAGVAAGGARDRCEWSLALLGGSEKGTDASNLGAMTGARGCVTQIQARVSNPGVSCVRGIYLVSVAWQGLHATIPPSPVCGKGQYGEDTMRRVITARVVAGTPECF